MTVMTRTFPLLPGWSQIAWTTGLLIVAAAHLRHAWRAHGKVRWWHGSHVLMTAGMICMYFPPAMMSHLFMVVKGPCLVIFSVAAAALITTTLMAWVRERRPDPLWLLITMDITAMACMWLPPGFRPAALTWVIIGYCSATAVTWLAGVWARPVCRTAAVPKRQAQPVPAGQPGADVTAITVAEPVAATVPEPRHALNPHGTLGIRAALAVMAAGMAYMFLAMP
jgi:hypothetical protein